MFPRCVATKSDVLAPWYPAKYIHMSNFRKNYWFKSWFLTKKSDQRWRQEPDRKIPNTRACFFLNSSFPSGLPVVENIRPHHHTYINVLLNRLPIVVDVFCRQPIRCPSPVGEFLVGSRRSSDNHGLELGIYINMIVRWFIHASVVSYVQNNNASGSIKTLEHVASLWDKIWLVSVARGLADNCHVRQDYETF